MAQKPAPKKAAVKKPAAAKKPAAPAKKTPPPAAKTKPALAKPAAPAKPPPKPLPKVAASAPKKALLPEIEFDDGFDFEPISHAAPPTPTTKETVKPAALTLSAQGSAGAAANGNTHPANILVLASSQGWPVTDLTKDHFTIMEYFEVPGQQAPFSNNITSFRNVGTGAYLLQVKPINGAPWRTGHHLAQILVSSADDRQGQAAVKVIIR